MAIKDDQYNKMMQDIADGFTANLNPLLRRGLEGVLAERTGRTTSGLDQWVAEFLQSKHHDAEQGKITPGRFANIKTNVERFRAFANGREVNSSLLVEYKAHLEGANHTPAFVKEHLAVAKQLCRWLYEQERIKELPRVIGGWSAGACSCRRLRSTKAT